MAGMNERRALQPATVEFLLSPRGEAVLAELAARPVGDADLLPTLTWLRRTLTAEEAGAALALAQLRRQAAAKFPQPAALYLTATALEQATAAPIAVRAPPGLTGGRRPAPCSTWAAASAAICWRWRSAVR